MGFEAANSHFKTKLPFFEIQLTQRKLYEGLRIAATCLQSFSIPWQRVVCPVFSIGILKFNKQTFIS